MGAIHMEPYVHTYTHNRKVMACDATPAVTSEKMLLPPSTTIPIDISMFICLRPVVLKCHADAF